ncbi:hypothetical protein BpHYR1_019732 [Brachionus plicatilis]|uniref:Uncharacterized protein n=1 Tax=Brachionus plicatilis TaxID=10195 RepID=A0A3M7PYV4_BRAPC|nr:hypothetical protein BpHYR1_019732 [Brachionus plicatilis]
MPPGVCFFLALRQRAVFFPLGIGSVYVAFYIVERKGRKACCYGLLNFRIRKALSSTMFGVAD